MAHRGRAQATSSRHYGEKDARLEYLSWRVWFMKRNRARAKQDQAKAHAAGVVEDVTAGTHGTRPAGPSRHFWFSTCMPEADGVWTAVCGVSELHV